jgi:hypothetical protein
MCYVIIDNEYKDIRIKGIIAVWISTKEGVKKLESMFWI